MTAILYVHGKGGSAAESDRYRPLFPDGEVTGLDYRTFTPWETGQEIHAAAAALKARRGRVTLIANSIGAFFSLHACLDGLEKGLPLPEPADLDLYHADEAALAELERLPGSPEEAAAAARGSAFIREHIPEQVMLAYGA